MNKFWERTFYFCTFIFQGSSFLNPRAYAIMHRMHHAYSDTEKDPHSPHFIKDVWGLMIQTKNIYFNYLKFKLEPEPQFRDRYPTWPALDYVGDLWVTRLGFVAFYIAFYVVFAPFWWLYLLLPLHFFMGPLHGAIVNWCGHKYGYSNFDNGDHSKNMLPLDFLMMGELFQNNHHQKPNDVNFAKRWFEFDPSYPVIKLMHWLGIIKLRKHFAPAAYEKMAAKTNNSAISAVCENILMAHTPCVPMERSDWDKIFLPTKCPEGTSGW